MLTEALAEAARYGKCPADLYGSLLRLVNWLRSEKRDFIEWANVTNYGHCEYLNWYVWITGMVRLPREDLCGLTGIEFYELVEEAGKTITIRSVA